MSGLQGAWLEAVRIGVPWLPYVALFIAAVVLLVLLVFLLYLLWRVCKRLPPLFRYVRWRVGLWMRQFWQWQSRRRADAGTLNVFDTQTGRSLRLGELLAADHSGAPPYLAIGAAGSGKSAWLNAIALPGSAASSAPEHVGGLLCWRTTHGNVLEIPHAWIEEAASPLLAQFAADLTRAAGSGPAARGLLLVVPIGVAGAANDTAAVVRRAFGLCRALDASLPAHLVLTFADTLPAYAAFSSWAADVDGPSLHFALREPARAGSGAQDAARAWTATMESRLDRSMLRLDGARRAADVLPLRPSLRRTVEPRIAEVLSALESRQTHGVEMPLAGGIALVGMSDSGRSADAAAAELFSSLLQPTPSLAGQARNRRLQAGLRFALAASMALAAVGALTTMLAARSNTRQLLGAMQEVSGLLGPTHSAGALPVQCGSARSLYSLLQTIQDVDGSSLLALMAPVSWTQSPRERSLAVLGQTLGQRWVAPRLRKLAETPLEIEEAATLAPGPAALRVEELPAWQSLRALLLSREQVDIPLRQLDSLSYDRLLQFLDSPKPPAERLAPSWRGDLPDATLAGLQASLPAVSQVSSALMSEAFARQWRDVVGQGLSQHEVLRLAMALASRIRSLAQGDPLDPESATELAIDLKAFQAQLRSPAARRVVGKVEDAQQFFLPALSRFSMASEVTTSMSADAVKLVASEFEAVRALLLKLEADGIGLLFVAGSDGFLRPSPEFDRFAKTAGAMIDTQRGGDSAYIEATFDDPGSRVWQVVSGEQSRTVLARRPKNGALPGLDERLGFALQQFAVEQYRLGVERALWLSVRRSRGAAGGASVRERVAGLRSSADFYQRAIGKDNIAEDSIVLVAMTEDGLQILSQLRADLAAADPYIQLMSELQRDWESAGGGAPLSASAVAARTGFARDTLREQYLAAAHKVLDALTALHGVVPRHPSTDFWRTLAQDFVQYDNSAPGNGISELEAAFLAATRASAGGRCKAGLEVRPPKGGYFGGRLAALEENFNRACDVARRHALQADYDGFAMWFNGAVAGHFPFGERVGALPLPPRVLPGLLERYRGLRDAQKAVGSEWPAEVKPFLPGLDALLAQYAGEGPAVGTSPGDVNTHKPLQYQLLLGQRRRHERLGEHVMEWRLTAGGREYRRKSEAQSFEWTIGERIELRLRFAANSPYRPVAGSGYSVDGAAAVFSFGGDWALYTMLKQHRTEATEARVATLRFQVQLEGPDGKQLAVVYADLIGNGPDSLRVLSLPARAPAFEASR